ncbi:MAG: hypothetical protein IJB35_02940 [Oscillospiraceae bacterium]|nr:hypothetical protein [Oscillospiraceae bacterium]
MAKRAAEIAPLQKNGTGNMTGKVKQCKLLQTADPHFVLLLTRHFADYIVIKTQVNHNILCSAPIIHGKYVFVNREMKSF